MSVSEDPQKSLSELHKPFSLEATGVKLFLYFSDEIPNYN